MQKIPAGAECIAAFRPVLQTAVYKTTVDVVGKHLSGLLIFKEIGDSLMHVVFSNEFGFTFFDFAFYQNGGFKVVRITPMMDKKAVIRTLRKDFELILFRHLDSSQRFTLRNDSLIYHGYPQEQGINYYITDADCSRLVKMQRASKKKPVVEAYMFPGETVNIPDSISINHLNFAFSISLKKISALELH